MLLLSKAELLLVMNLLSRVGQDATTGILRRRGASGERILDELRGCIKC